MDDVMTESEQYYYDLGFEEGYQTRADEEEWAVYTEKLDKEELAMGKASEKEKEQEDETSEEL